MKRKRRICMESLFNLGISDKVIVELVERCPTIRDMDNNEIEKHIQMLEFIGCSDKIKKNIIESNPEYLDRILDDVFGVMKYLVSIGFTRLDILFDSNPYILNLDVFEIKEYVDKKLNEGSNIEEVVDELESNPYLFNEM